MGLQAAAFVPQRQPLSHGAWIVVIVVMVAMLGVCNLQAGFPLWLFAISCVWPGATWRALLEEVRHKVHLQKNKERRENEG